MRSKTKREPPPSSNKLPQKRQRRLSSKSQELTSNKELQLKARKNSKSITETVKDNVVQDVEAVVETVVAVEVIAVAVEDADVAMENAVDADVATENVVDVETENVVDVETVKVVAEEAVEVSKLLPKVVPKEMVMKTKNREPKEEVVVAMVQEMQSTDSVAKLVKRLTHMIRNLEPALVRETSRKLATEEAAGVMRRNPSQKVKSQLLKLLKRPKKDLNVEKDAQDRKKFPKRLSQRKKRVSLFKTS